MTALFQPLDDAVSAIMHGIPWHSQSGAPDTLEGLTAIYRETGRIAVSPEHSGDTIFGSPRINHMARAWHDWHHVHLQAPFNLKGGLAVYHAQTADLRRFLENMRIFRRCRDILFADVVGQTFYNALHGTFPVNQRAFVKAFLADGERAIMSREFSE